MNPATATRSSSLNGLAQAAEEMGERLGDLSYALRPLLVIRRHATAKPNATRSPSELVQFELLRFQNALRAVAEQPVAWPDNMHGLEEKN